MAGKSVGGRGLFHYVKIKNKEKLRADNFMNIYEYFRTEIFKDLPIDNNAKGISRPQFIPYDKELYINNDIEIDIPKYLFNNNHSKSIVDKNCALQDNNRTKSDVLVWSAQSVPLLDINDVLKDLKTETFVDVGDEDFIIKPILYSKLYVPAGIRVGNRHKTFRAMINCIMHNNPNFTPLQVLSFMNYINFERTESPLTQKEMIRTITAHYFKIKTDGIQGLKTKSVHTNPNLSPYERSKISNQQNGKLKVDKSIEVIRLAVDYLRDIKIKPTIKLVTGILKGYRSERTIKKYWRQVVPKDNLQEICDAK